ncbi:DUF3352 domain-containing protein [Candidatus Uabimicrobium amorphum]|uniref:Uncharacterized protein n=1 Tax=Uabimicrobium amorphum TaxID=2596890 RepID=A0A5S9IPI8_UABAM|nr:DUF3352 domain-containing protein [Candidatus Uabimicrobium amorphum]BBM85723.1 hypothetical protein UABAM_04101 [Candidatus Uabimicrobium amorphum]
MFKYLFPILIVLLVFPFNTFSEDFNAADYISDGTLLYVEMENGQKFCEQMREIGLWQLFASDEWKAFFDTIPPEFVEMIRGQQKQFEMQAGVTLKDVAEAFSGHFSIAAMDVIPGPMPMPAVLLSWDMGKQADKVSTMLLQMYQGLVPGAQKEQYEYNGQTVYQLATPAMPAYCAVVNNVMLLSTSKTHLEAVLSGKHKNSLQSYARYQEIKKRTLRGRSGLFVYANAERMMQMGVQMSGQAQQVQPMIDMIGVDALKGIGTGFYFKSTQVVESFYIHMPGERKGILGKILPSKPASKNLEKYIPEDLVAFRHSYFELRGFVEAGLEALQMFAPRQHQQFMGMEQQFNQQLGVNLREDVIYNMGDEYLSSVSLSGGLIPDFAIQFSLKDPKVFTAAIEKLLQMVPKKHRYKFLWNGYNFHYFNFSSMSEPIPVAPTFVIDGNRILITLYPEMAKNLIVQKNGHFPKDMMTYLDGYEHTDIQYLNVEKLVVPLYRTAIPFVQSMIPRSEVPIEFGLLPSGNTLKKYVNNAMMVWFTDQAGMCFEMHSPFGLVGPLAALGAMAEQNSPYNEPYDPDYDDSPVDEPVKEKEPTDVVVEEPAGEGVSSELLGVEDSRTWKNTNVKSKVSVYFGKSSLKVHLFAPMPPSVLSYGNFKLTATDNLGNAIKYKPGFGFRTGSEHKKVDSYALKNVIRDKGMRLDLQFSSPSRDAKSISLTGSFEIKTAEAKTLELKSYGDLRKNLHVSEDISGLKIQFTKDCKEKSVNLRISGDPVKLKTIYAKKGETVYKSNGWSSYKSKGDTVTSYWFKDAIPDDANIYFEYADNVKVQKITVDVKDQMLP